MKKQQPGDAKKKPQQPAQQAKKQREDSDDIERAVYDGMQDLRTKKPADR